jgi:hypothetical protein
MGGWEIGEGVGWVALGFWDYLDAGLPVAKSALYYFRLRQADRVQFKEGSILLCLLD